MNITDTRTVEQVTGVLSKALPGFESQISVEGGGLKGFGGLVTISVRGPVWFNGSVKVDQLTIPLATDEANEAYYENVMRLVRGTRAHAIERLGLDEEIKQQVEEQVRIAVGREKNNWEQKGWQKGYAEATKELIVTLRDALAAPPAEREL